MYVLNLKDLTLYSLMRIHLQMYKPMSIELVNDGTVDVFFMISGFMTFHFGITSMTKGGLFYMVFSILTRWIK